MTNFEKNTDRLLAIISDENDIPAIVNNIPVPCVGTNCNSCYFLGDCNMHRFMIWLAEECVESVTLNKKERMFCELVETGYIARDNDNSLYWYKNIPNKRVCDWFDPNNTISVNNLYEYSSELKFDFIKWEDEKPWSVEDLLKLEVRDE